MLKGILFILMIVSLRANAQQSEGYTIEGHMEGLEEGEKVTMLLYNGRGQGIRDEHLIARDSAYVKDGVFYLSGIVPEGPRLYWMVFDKHLFVSRKLILFIDNGEHITIHSPDIVKINHEWIQHYVTIEGSPTNFSMLHLSPAMDLYRQSIFAIRDYVQRLTDSIGFNGTLLDAAFALRDKINNAFYYTILHGGKNRDPELQAADINLPTGAGLFNLSGHASFWIDFYKDLDERKKSSAGGKWLKDLTTLCVGQPFPEFTLPAVSGDSLGVKDIASRNKLTLVHFWASNARNRVEYQDELKMIYNKYRNKGLGVIAVSCDRFAEEWKNVLKKEKYPWMNVIDSGGQMTEHVYYEYRGYRNEDIVNVLIDGKGKIIAWGVNGGELQWHLSKRLGQ